MKKNTLLSTMLLLSLTISPTQLYGGMLESAQDLFSTVVGYVWQTSTVAGSIGGTLFMLSLAKDYINKQSKMEPSQEDVTILERVNALEQESAKRIQGSATDLTGRLDDQTRNLSELRKSLKNMTERQGKAEKSLESLVPDVTAIKTGLDQQCRLIATDKAALERRIKSLENAKQEADTRLIRLETTKPEQQPKENQ